MLYNTKTIKYAGVFYTVTLEQCATSDFRVRVWRGVNPRYMELMFKCHTKLGTATKSFNKLIKALSKTPSRKNSDNLTLLLTRDYKYIG